MSHAVASRPCQPIVLLKTTYSPWQLSLPVGVELLILSLNLRVENVPLLRTGQFDTVSEASELADHSDRSGPPGSFVRRRAAFLVLDPVAGEFPIRYTKDVQPAPRSPLGPIRGAVPTL